MSPLNNNTLTSPSSHASAQQHHQQQQQQQQQHQQQHQPQQQQPHEMSTSPSETFQVGMPMNLLGRKKSIVQSVSFPSGKQWCDLFYEKIFQQCFLGGLSVSPKKTIKGFKTTLYNGVVIYFFC